MFNIELYYLRIEDNKQAHFYKVVHLFSPDLMLAKRIDFDGGEDSANSLDYCEIERTGDGDPRGYFFDSIERAIEMVAENTCRFVNHRGEVIDLLSMVPGV